MSAPGTILREAVGDFRATWKTLALTDIAYKVIAFILLTPLVGVLFHALLALSGQSVLADQDILWFLLGPVGWVCLISVGAVALGILALKQAALLGILDFARRHQRLSALDALRFAAVNAWPVVHVAARLIAWTLVVAAPFLILAGITYVALLTGFDINYYLKEKPSEFVLALAIGAVIVILLLAILLRLFTGWFFALPIVLFEDVKPSDALKASSRRAAGHRKTIGLSIVGWCLATSLLSSAVTLPILGLGRFLVPRATGSLHLLLLAVGMVLVLLSAVGLVVNVISSTSFAAMLFSLYRSLGSDGRFDRRLPDASRMGSGTARFRWSRTRILAGGGAGVLLAVIVGAVAVRSVRLEDTTTVTAHRGSSAAAPENTMAAVKQAIADGTDWVEIDVQETADGEVVVFHDSDFMKLAGRDLKIWDATMADLKEIDIGSWFAPEFSSERVPTLADVLTECHGKAGVNIELKYYGHDQQLEQRVVDIVEAHGMESEIVIMSLKNDALKKMKSLRPDWKAGLLMSVSAGKLDQLEADFLAVNAAFVNRDLIRTAHASGKEIYVWTVNDAVTMSNMIGCGVDSLITDKPALARRVLEARAQMSAPERLLLELAGMLGIEPEIGEP